MQNATKLFGTSCVPVLFRVSWLWAIIDFKWWQLCIALSEEDIFLLRLNQAVLQNAMQIIICIFRVHKPLDVFSPGYIFQGLFSNVCFYKMYIYKVYLKVCRALRIIYSFEGLKEFSSGWAFFFRLGFEGNVKLQPTDQGGREGVKANECGIWIFSHSFMLGKMPKICTKPKTILLHSSYIAVLHLQNSSLKTWKQLNKVSPCSQHQLTNTHI